MLIFGQDWLREKKQKVILCTSVYCRHTGEGFIRHLGWNIFKNILCIECTMAEVWMPQTITNTTWFRKAVEQKLGDIWVTLWYSNLESKEWRSI